MPKAMCTAGIVVALLLFLLFGLDLAISFPFGRPSLMMDVGFVVCALILAAISWLTLREQQ